MAKKINDIIRESVEYILTEQKKGTKLNPFSPTNPDSLKANRVFYHSEDTMEWPSNLARKFYPKSTETMFKNMGAKPFTYGKVPENSKGQIPQMYFPFAGETFRFQPDGTVKTKAGQQTMYWKYIHKPFVVNQDPDQDAPVPLTKNSKINVNEQFGPMTISPIIKKSTDAVKSYSKVSSKINYSKPGTGKIEVSRTKLGEPEFTIYISVTGQPAIMYEYDLKQAESAAKWADTKSYIRASMDIIGFVPFIGDAVDLVGAGWYLRDFLKYGNWSDLAYCFLNIIAAWPVFGSFVKAAIKGIVSKISQRMAAKGVKALTDEVVILLQKYITDGNPTEQQLELIKKTAPYVFNKFINYSNTLKRKLKLTPEQLTRWNDFESAILELANKLPRTVDSVLASRSASKYGIDLASGAIDPTKLDKFVSLIIRAQAGKLPKAELTNLQKMWAVTKKIITPAKWIRPLTKWAVKPKTASIIYKSIQRSFEREIFESLTNSAATSFALKLIATASSRTRRILYDKITEYIRFSGTNATIPAFESLTNLQKWKQLLDQVSASALENLARDFSSICITQGHRVWGMILSDPSKQLTALLKTTGKETWQLFLDNITATRKILRMAVMALHDASYDIGGNWADSDQQSIIYQAIKQLIVDEDSKYKKTADKSNLLKQYLVDPLNSQSWIPNVRNDSPRNLYTIPGYDRPNQWIDPATDKTKTKTTTPKVKAKVTPETKPTVTPKVTPKPTVTPKVTPKVTIEPKKSKTPDEEENQLYDKSGNIDASKLVF